MQQPRTHARLLWFTYLLSLYGSIAFPWTTTSEQVYGLKIAGFDDIKVDDVIEFFHIIKIARTL